MSTLTRVQLRMAAGLLRLPPSLVARLLPPLERDGAVLDPLCHLSTVLARLAARPTLDTLEAEAARVEYARLNRLLDPPPAPDVRSEDRMLPGRSHPIPVRAYHPKGAPRPAPALLYLHGGGFVLGDLETHDATCRALAAAFGAPVVAVDYRRAPEHPFPAAVEDAFDGFTALVAAAPELGLDPAQIAVGGDSAGGNLAAVVAHCARDAGGPRPSFQLLVYPATDMRRHHASHQTFARGFHLDRPLLDYFTRHYLVDQRRVEDPRASPLLAPDLAGLPPALVITAGFDPLRDEGEAYAQALRAAGVPVTLERRATLLHGFWTMSGVLAEARQAIEAAGAALRQAHGLPRR